MYLFSHRTCTCLKITNEAVRCSPALLSKLDLLESSCTSLEIPLLCLEVGQLSPMLADGAFEALKNLSLPKPRGTLLVAGGMLEDQISMMVLHALAEGYDVHLLTDVMAAWEPRNVRWAQLRLFQAGAVPTSLRQILYQWLSVEHEVEARTILEDILASYTLTSC